MEAIKKLETRESINKKIYRYKELSFQGGAKPKEEMMNIATRLLMSFKLPATLDNYNIIEKADWNQSANLACSVLRSKLNQAAIQYLSAPVKTNRQLLFEDFCNQDIGYDILMQMGLPINDYNLFIYDYLWRRNMCLLKDVLKECTVFNQIPEACEFTVERNLSAPSEAILRKAGLKYVDDFFIYLDLQKKPLQQGGFTGSTFDCIMHDQSYLYKMGMFRNVWLKAILFMKNQYGCWHEIILYLNPDNLSVLPIDNTIEYHPTYHDFFLSEEDKLLKHLIHIALPLPVEPNIF